MAKDKEKNIVTHSDGSVSDAQPQPKSFNLADLGIDADFAKTTIRPLLKDLVVQGVREQLGMKKSELRHNSKAYKISIFVKEVGWSLLAMGGAAMAMIIFFRLVLRWVGL